MIHTKSSASVPTLRQIDGLESEDDIAARISPLDELGIRRTEAGRFRVGTYRYSSLTDAIVRARWEQSRRDANADLKSAQQAIVRSAASPSGRAADLHVRADDHAKTETSIKLLNEAAATRPM